MNEQDKTKAGIGPGLIRLAIGYTGSAEQRWHQLSSALKQVKMLA